MNQSRGSEGSIRCPVCDKTSAHESPSGVIHSEPATHCEWCGAEYPLPDATDDAKDDAKDGGSDDPR